MAGLVREEFLAWRGIHRDVFQEERKPYSFGCSLWVIWKEKDKRAFENIKFSFDKLKDT